MVTLRQASHAVAGGILVLVGCVRSEPSRNALAPPSPGVFDTTAGLHAVVAQPGTTGSRSDVRSLAIRPGRGLDVLGIGDTGDRVRAVFGEPDRVRDFGNGTAMLDYRESLSLDFLVKGNDRIVTEVRFNRGFRGRTPDGLSLGDSLDRVLQASGGATRTIAASPAETHGARLGSDRVLYEQTRGDVVNARKFMDDHHGILYWFDVDGRVTQIVAFRAK